jgi:hypothetical protein
MRGGSPVPAAAAPSGACAVHKDIAPPTAVGLAMALHVVDGYGLRNDSATTGHAGAAAARDRQGRADGPPGT